MTIKLTLEDLLLIEESISSIRYQGAAMGGILNDYLSINNKNQTWEQSGGRYINAWFFNIRILINFIFKPLSNFRSIKHLNNNNNFLLFTSISDKAHLRGLVETTARVLMERQHVCVAIHSKKSQTWPDKCAVFDFDEIFDNIKLSNIWAAIKAVRCWKQVIEVIRQKYNLPKFFNIEVMGILMLSSIRYNSAIFWLKKNQPKAIIVEYDRNQLLAPLVLAAQVQGIKTITFQHGMINGPVGYLPLLADMILVWGKTSWDTLIRFGLNPQRAIIAGCPAVNIQISQPVQLKSTDQLPHGNLRILLATSPINNEYRDKLYEVFYGSVKDINGLVLSIRPHPSEDTSFYRKKIADKNINLISAKNVSPHISLTENDLIICHNSGIGLEAMLYGKPVVVLDAISQPLLGASDWLEAGAAALATNVEELQRLIVNFISRPFLLTQLANKGHQYADQVYAATGQTAASNSSRIIEAFIN